MSLFVVVSSFLDVSSNTNKISSVTKDIPKLSKLLIYFDKNKIFLSK